jgi:superfamily II DNA or RNA helicase
MTILRPYQEQALTALREARQASPDVTRLAVEMATGLGKTITFAAELDEWLDKARPSFGEVDSPRVLILVHLDHLARQAVERVQFVTRGRWTVGTVMAGQNEVAADVVVASVQTLAQPGRKDQITNVGKIIIDEAHHATAKSYVDILEHYGALPDCDHRGRSIYDPGCMDCMNTGYTSPPVPVTGYTATLARTDGQGLGHIFQDLAFSRGLPWGIRHGYLIDLVPYTITIPGVDGSASDSALDAMLADSIAPEAVVNAWLEQTEDKSRPIGSWPERPSTVLFAPLVRSAEAFAEAFNAAGVKAEVVAGAYTDAHNLAVLARYEAGVTTVVCNAMKLTEGWDSPRTMCVIVARPTQSVPLFVQMIGRGLRPWLDAIAPPRVDQRCILLCVAGTTKNIVTVADLSDRIGEVRDGTSFLAMEDEFDLGKDIEPDVDMAYRGPVRVEQWDAIVQASSKAWKYTDGGVPFLPLAKRSALYVFVVDTANGYEVWAREIERLSRSNEFRVHKLSTAPDLELAMALAEDEAQELGGDIGALLADKGRPWRKAVPSLEQLSEARRKGIPEAEIQKILTSKASGKAGKLSDLIDRVTATRALDHNVTKIRERARA